MNIATKFDLGEVVFSAQDARSGALIKMLVKEIKVEVFVPQAPVISYLVRTNERMTDGWYSEGSLLTEDDAKTIVLSVLNKELTDTQAQIDEING